MKQQELPLPQCGNRVLHMSEDCLAHLENVVRPRAKEAGLEDGPQKDIYLQLNQALDYCRTFSKGPEEDWKSTLALDIPFNHDDMNFILSVCKRVHPGTGEFHDSFGARDNSLNHYYTVGMIWSDGKGWSMHS